MTVSLNVKVSHWQLLILFKNSSLFVKIVYFKVIATALGWSMNMLNDPAHTYTHLQLTLALPRSLWVS